MVRKGDEVWAFAPAYIKLDSYGEFIFDQSWAEFSELRLGRPYYPKLVLAVPFTPATGSRVLLRKGLSQSEREEIFVNFDWTEFEDSDQSMVVLGMQTGHGRSTPLVPQNRHEVPVGRQVLVVREEIDRHRIPSAKKPSAVA